MDLLEGIFSLWMAKGREAMDVKRAFDVRVRQLMQSRVENKVCKVEELKAILSLISKVKYFFRNLIKHFFKQSC